MWWCKLESESSEFKLCHSCTTVELGCLGGHATLKHLFEDHPLLCLPWAQARAWPEEITMTKFITCFPVGLHSIKEKHFTPKPRALWSRISQQYLELIINNCHCYIKTLVKLYAIEYLPTCLWHRICEKKLIYT